MSVGQQVIKTFEANLDSLYPMLRFIKMHAKNVGFSGTPLSRIELASEEALVNIIEYAYPDEEEGSIQIKLSGLGKDELRVTIIDCGIPFNPLSNSKKFQVKSFETNPTIGGYGTYFIMELMDRVEYDRRGETNILTLIKRVSRK
ncbi:MAG: Serine-protein kinase RsbW [Chlamydiae bacterium]|nr:Serine-protein kinase RsbW [Chlamydiota bacterium]